MPNHLLNLAINAALAAGEEILEIYNSSIFSIEFKKDHSPLTKADKAAHQIIFDYLSDTPYPILSEEGVHLDFQTRKNWETYWLVDPLDGTKEFINRNGEFTVNIALIQKNTPILGIVYSPISRELYFANENGSYKTLNNEKHSIIIEKAVKLPLLMKREDFIVLASRSHLTLETEEFINHLETGDKLLRIISKGSSIKFCMIAEGSAHCYPRFGTTMEWDTAAGHAIVKYAGKSVNIHPENKPLAYNKENLQNPWFIAE